MLHIREECQRISSSEYGPTFRRARNRIKLWWNRDEIEAEIRRLKERVNDCYIQFTVGLSYDFRALILRLSGILRCPNRTYSW
jgi:hypothetical protein